MSATIYHISSHHRYVKGSRRGKQSVFNLGYHFHSCNPGSHWSANYWIKKKRGGIRWELYCAFDGGLSYRNRVFGGEYSALELKDYLSSINFELEEEHWREIGLGFPAEVVCFKLFAIGRDRYMYVSREE